MKPIARKYRFEEVPSEKERWQALPLEVRLQAVVEMAFFWARLQGQQNLEKIQPVARKRPLTEPAPRASGESGGCS
ncbi:hypothetical protein [Meiothermus ruber]|jgi:hypothetical protein|uniref:Uncharacterized protein n=1 Tax=Meiothermus ruber (strain ATCC 35948 / DSM 1279 / VKM B-1258 / 21) TaxID=504728 RepID=D3PKR7_MEIRD|nr:hypothetical protein [Meiothermus ruber]ADD28941.1 hypothetical protein Mrub_2187 [Meiothermus ruber DSM 1279]AGK05610.1 hypothetical protein K649_11600 [Meiothermus ruber DSM 1279]MCL6528727.1 hypothetical protein [Meiothermus ruber]GAO75858.1 putative uncharacterized protein [Meiothermus ruber H328]